jgi:hypothetical protein
MKTFAVITMLATLAGGAEPRHEIVDVMELGRVPAGFPVRFALLTAENHQFVACYDAERQMVVKMRELGSDRWDEKILPSRVGWDSHNGLTMALDEGGHLHVSGNMHVDPLVYFRATRPHDIQSLQAKSMTGRLEDKATYPHFLKDAEGRLLFHYRHGGSGRGIRLWNCYDVETEKWSRLHDTPLFDGQGATNAYPVGPRKLGDGRFHMIWVWRDTPDCATNHHLSYARSDDAVHWESAFGHEVKLPILESHRSLWIDPIPSGGGIINGGHRLILDRRDQPLVVYHKRDQAGHMQIFAARPVPGDRWEIRPLTAWTDPVPFGGRGSMGFIGIDIGRLERVRPGVMMVTYRHRTHGRGRLFFDEERLQALDRKIQVEAVYPSSMQRVTSDFPGMGIRRARDLGSAPDPEISYLLQWETLGANHDRPRQPPLPEPSVLRLYQLRKRVGP